MEKITHKFELEREGRKYILLSEITEGKIRITCVDVNRDKPLLFIGYFSLSDLNILSPVFNSVSNIYEAQKIINQTIEEEKVKIEYFENYINVKFFIIKGGIKENQYLDLKCNIITKEPIYNKLIVLRNITRKTSYSPPSVLPRRYVVMPPTIDGNMKITYSPVKRLPDKQTYLPSSTSVSPTTYTDIKEESTNYSEKTYNQNNMKIKKLHLSLSPESNIGNINNYSFYQNEVRNLSPFNNSNYYEPSSPIIESKLNYSTSPNQFLSPKREQIEYLNNGSPSRNIINYSAISSHKTSNQNKTILNQSKNNSPNNIKLLKPMVENNNDNQNTVHLQNENNNIKEELKLLKIENNKLINENKNLKNEIEILNRENNILRNNKNLQSIENDEIILLKKEIEKLNKEVLDLKNQKNNEFDLYKKVKEEEISLLKMQINNLLKNNKKMKNYNNNTLKKNKKLKLQIEQLLENKKNNINILKSKYNNCLENQTLYMQNMSSKIVKGEIIRNREELEFLVRKICKDKKK